MKKKIFRLFIVFLILSNLNYAAGYTREQITDIDTTGFEGENPLFEGNKDLKDAPFESEDEEKQKDSLYSDMENADNIELTDVNDLDTKQVLDLQWDIESAIIETASEGRESLNIPQEDIVYNEYELRLWLENHSDTGGSVFLGDNITISRYFSVNTPHFPHYTIYTGSYGITFDGGSFFLKDFEIIGEGVDVPVVYLKNTDSYFPDWNLYASYLNITSTGRDGIGGTALLVTQDDGSYFDIRNSRGLGRIRSYGSGAIGIKLTVPLYAYCLTVAVEGDNSIAVYAPEGTHLIYNKLSAVGEGASVISGSGIVLNTCLASPMPNNATIINRRFFDVAGNNFYLPIPQYSNLTTINNSIPKSEYFLLDEGDGYGVMEPFLMDWVNDDDWEINLLKDVDFNVLGQTTIRGNVVPFFQDFGLDENFSIELIVDVRDPNIPCIEKAYYEKGFDEDTELKCLILRLQFWRPAKEGERFALMRSDDYGKTWRDISDLPGVKWYEMSLRFFSPEIESSVMFRLDSTENGKSNIVIVNPYDIYSSGGIDGRRDGSDRIPIIPNNYLNNNTDEEIEPEGDRDSDNVVESKGNNNWGNGSKPKSSDSSDSYPQEWEDENTLMISGKRLEAMMDANPERVTFIKEGIQLSIESDVLQELELSENQSLGIQIEKLPEDSFSVSFWTDNTEIQNLPFMAYIDENVFNDFPLQSVICSNDQGETYSSVYDSIAKKITVSLAGSGTFTFIPNMPISASEPSAMPINDSSNTMNLSSYSDSQYGHYAWPHNIKIASDVTSTVVLAIFLILLGRFSIMRG